MSSKNNEGTLSLSSSSSSSVVKSTGVFKKPRNYTSALLTTSTVGSSLPPPSLPTPQVMITPPTVMGGCSVSSPSKSIMHHHNQLDFSKEIDRLASFTADLNWIDRDVLIKDLSMFGMYFVGSFDNCKCYFCGVLIGSWTLENSNVMYRHLFYSPLCPLFRCDANTNNKPIDKNEFWNTLNGFNNQHKSFINTDVLNMLSRGSGGCGLSISTNHFDTNTLQERQQQQQHNNITSNCGIEQQEYYSYLFNDEYNNNNDDNTIVGGRICDVITSSSVDDDINDDSIVPNIFINKGYNKHNNQNYRNNYHQQHHQQQQQQEQPLPFVTKTFGKLIHADVVYQQYINDDYRLKSFNLWPVGLKQRAIDMCLAGFFYTGNGDRVKCFNCAISICDWGEKVI